LRFFFFYSTSRNLPEFLVEEDKGFFYSHFDESFVCQKKNHFQISTYTRVASEPVYCKPSSASAVGLFHEIDKIELNIYGVKKEESWPLEKIQVKQSDASRRHMNYEPAECRLKGGVLCRTTKSRLHFAQTTKNNNKKRCQSGDCMMLMRNPEQRYFQLIVQLEIVTKNNANGRFTLCASISEPFIVRVGHISNCLFKVQVFVDYLLLQEC
jgi:hypothetical protein